MTINPTELLKSYRAGLSFREGDVLKLRSDIAPAHRPHTFDVIDGTEFLIAHLDQAHTWPAAPLLTVSLDLVESLGIAQLNAWHLNPKPCAVNLTHRVSSRAAGS